MSCRDVRRAVAAFCLFEERGSLTTPHLEHLSACRGCREEAGLNRALVRELRRALTDRVEGHAPSAAAWQGVLRRAQEPPAPAGWRRLLPFGRPAALGPLVGRLRTASVAMSMVLAVLLANGQNSLPSVSFDVATGVPSVGDQFERRAALPNPVGISLTRPQIVDVLPTRPEPVLEEPFLNGPSLRRPAPAQPIASPEPADEEDEDEEEEEEKKKEQPDEEQSDRRLVWQLYPPMLDPTVEAAAAGGGSATPAVPVQSVPGEPS